MRSGFRVSNGNVVFRDLREARHWRASPFYRTFAGQLGVNLFESNATGASGLATANGIARYEFPLPQIFEPEYPAVYRTG